LQRQATCNKNLRLQQQVLGLEVSHDHALAVKLHKSRQDLASVAQQLLQRQATCVNKSEKWLNKQMVAMCHL
jgi:hypothetical protein